MDILYMILDLFGMLFIALCLVVASFLTGIYLDNRKNEREDKKYVRKEPYDEYAIDGEYTRDTVDEYLKSIEREDEFMFNYIYVMLDEIIKDAKSKPFDDSHTFYHHVLEGIDQERSDYKQKREEEEYMRSTQCQIDRVLDGLDSAVYKELEKKKGNRR